MTAWATLRRIGAGVVFPLVLSFLTPLRAAGDPAKTVQSGKPSAAAIRAAAEAAEKAGDWEAAFTSYCHLFVADRAAPDVRERLNAALRRTQQLRRHRDPQFQHYVATTSPSAALDLFADIFTKVPVLYVDRDRATPQILWEHGIEELSRALVNPAFQQAFLDNPAFEKLEWFRTTLRISWAKQNITDARSARAALKRLLTAAQEAFSIRLPSAIVLEMICGSCSGLDEYTVFLNPAQMNPDSPSTNADLSAQGIYLTITSGKLIVAGIAPGSWAAFHAKPLRKGDQIVAINDRPMPEGLVLATVAEALRNPNDGFHDLVVAPANPEMLPEVVRLPAHVPTVFGTEMKPSKGGIRVGYIRLGSFGSSTPRELDEAILLLKGAGARTFVLDLRGNMGGSFLAGVETAKRLLPTGLIVTTQGQAAEVDNIPYSSDSGMSAHDIPVVVLVDAETASAAEVLVAALKDHERATLVGMPTFGKGAIQYPVRLDWLEEKDASGKPNSAKTSGVRLTIAKLIAPRGAVINGVGVNPHILAADPTQQLELALRKAVDLLPTAPMQPAAPMMMAPLPPSP